MQVQCVFTTTERKLTNYVGFLSNLAWRVFTFVKKKWFVCQLEKKRQQIQQPTCERTSFTFMRTLTQRASECMRACARALVHKSEAKKAENPLQSIKTKAGFMPYQRSEPQSESPHQHQCRSWLAPWTLCTNSDLLASWSLKISNQQFILGTIY